LINAFADSERWLGNRADKPTGFVGHFWRRFFDRLRSVLVALNMASADQKLEDIFWRASTGRLGGGRAGNGDGKKGESDTSLYNRRGQQKFRRNS